MKENVIFGPAGSPIDYKGAAYKAPKYISQEGLDSYEYQSPYGVRIGEKAAKSVNDFFSSIDTIILLNKLSNYGVNPQGTAVQKESNIFEGKTFVITGTLSMPRTFFEEKIKKNGGKVSSSVSKKTSYVLAGENAGSKFDKALALGVIILTEEDFNSLFEGIL